MSYFCRRIIFAEGERWIQRYILEHPDEFKGRTLTFESRLDAGETVRRVDVVERIDYDFILESDNYNRWMFFRISDFGKYQKVIIGLNFRCTESC